LDEAAAVAAAAAAAAAASLVMERTKTTVDRSPVEQIKATWRTVAGEAAGRSSCQLLKMIGRFV